MLRLICLFILEGKQSPILVAYDWVMHGYSSLIVCSHEDCFK